VNFLLTFHRVKLQLINSKMASLFLKKSRAAATKKPPAANMAASGYVTVVQIFLVSV
jgi:hypothetical protein